MEDNDSRPAWWDRLTQVWHRVEAELPPGHAIGGVAYHGPGSIPGKEWIAYLYGPEGGGVIVGPEGVGGDPIAALEDVLVQARRRPGPWK